MNRERFFSEDYRAFCNGELSLCVDRFGGIESLHMLDIFEFEGKLYPERKAWRIFSRNGTGMNRPYISPAIRFVKENAEKSVRALIPEYPELGASGVRSREYELYTGHDFFSVKGVETEENPERSFLCAISKLQFFEHILQEESCYNQLAHEHVWLPPKYRGADFREDWPFPDGKVVLERKAPVFDSKNNALIFSVYAHGACFEKELKIAFSSSEVLVSTEDTNQWLLSTPCSEVKEVVWGCGMAENAEASIAKARSALMNHDENLRKHMDVNRFPNHVKVSVEGLEGAGHFAKMFPYYQHALLLAETETSAAIRAAFNKFGFFAIWDHIYPARDFLVCGEKEMTGKALRYMADYPHWDTNPFVLMHLSIALNEYLAFEDDAELRHDFLKAFKKSFTFAETLCDPETGLIRYGIDTAVDVMPELGLDNLFYASCVNGWWFDACCSLMNFALDEGDDEFFQRVSVYEEKIASHYEKVFFDGKSGYLRAAVGENGQQMTHEVFLHTKSLALDYIHGLWLFRRIAHPMSDYLMKRLHHPLGVSAVAFDSEAPAIYLKGTRMNQHIGHSCKMLRFAGSMDGVRHLLSGYLYMFEKYQNAIETFNYSYCAGNQSQSADWQAFSATAAMQAILQGMCGVFWHRGGLFFMPADDSKRIELENFHFGGRVYRILVEGKGAFVGKMSLNGRSLNVSSMQLSADDLASAGNEVQWRIERTEKAPERAVLRYVLDERVFKLESGDDFLCFECGDARFTQMEFYTPFEAVLKLDGSEVESEYDEGKKRLYFKGCVEKGMKVEVAKK